MYATEVSRHVDAPHSAVYRALLDADAVAAWRTPDGMSSRVHAFDAREGGRVRVSPTYDTSGGGTGVHVRHEDLPDAVPAADNATGRRVAPAHLARHVEWAQRSG